MTTVAGRLVRQARLDAGLTQRQLARLSGVAAPTLSAYETGAQDPSSTALDKVLRATGRELTAKAVRPVQSLHVEAVMQLTDALPTRVEADLAFPPFRTLLRAAHRTGTDTGA
jgi:transcriptional regulator with XRE-family HTH domain